MKKIYPVLVICSLLLLVPLSAISSSLTVKTTNQTSVDTSDSIKATITIHRLDKKEQIIRYVSPETINQFKKFPNEVDLLELLPRAEQHEVAELINQEYEKLQKMTVRDLSRNYPLVSWACEKLDLDESKTLSDIDADTTWAPFNLTFNVLCHTTGVGVFLLLPPFIPITPMLFATFVLFYTNGLMGEKLHFVTFALAAPFIGLSLYTPTGVFGFDGFAGVTVGTKS